MRLRALIAGPLLLFVALNSIARNEPDLPIFDGKRCGPKTLKKKNHPAPKTIHTRKNEKPSGFPPLITFEIPESGDVVKARVTRSSGIADIDASALRWVRSFRYNARPGCGAIQQEAVVTVDLTNGY